MTEQTQKNIMKTASVVLGGAAATAGVIVAATGGGAGDGTTTTVPEVTTTSIVSAAENTTSTTFATTITTESGLVITTDTSDITTVTTTEPTTSTTATTKVTTRKPKPTTTKKKATTTTKPTTTTTTKPTQVKYDVPDTEAIAREILNLINEERKALGRCELNTAPIAHEIATVRANELQILYSHYRPDGMPSGYIYTEYQYGEQRGGELGVPDGNGGYTWIKTYTTGGGSENISSAAWTDTDTNDPEILARLVIYGQTDAKVQEYFPGLAGTGYKGSRNHWNDITNELYTGIGIGVSIVPSEDDGWYRFRTAILTMKKTYG